jgi:hypothetical protein
MKHGIQIFYERNCFEPYLKLRHTNWYIDLRTIKHRRRLKENEIPKRVKPDRHCIVIPQILWKSFMDYNELCIPACEIFQFSDKVQAHGKLSLPISEPYIALHIRLGDKFLETEKKNILCPNDVRQFAEEQLFSFLTTNSNRTIVVFCDNRSYKEKLKQLYTNLILTECAVGHTSSGNSTEQEALGAFAEFYLMTKSEKIVAATRSGFSIMASKMYQCPITDL